LAEVDAGLLAPGKIFHDHYEVVRCISTGAMGAVYEVVDQKTLRRRALKVMLPSLVGSPEMRERFKLEATVTADIVSEHIVETFDADVDAATGAPFLVMELLRGDDLANILGQRERLKPAEVVLILSQAARALDKTHAAGIVHRDLKPENIFITTRDDGTPRIKILDFGIAKVLATTQPGTKQQTINLGTPPYMSPEQIMGSGGIDHRADLYALAHIAYALLVGEPYWLEESRQLESLYTLLLRICEGAKEPASIRAQRYGVTLPPAFDTWFSTATAPKPEFRYLRASDLVLTLAGVLNVRLDTRPTTASGTDWELDSMMMSRTSVQRLSGSVPYPRSSDPPSNPGRISGPPIVAPPLPPPLPPAPSLQPYASGSGMPHMPGLAAPPPRHYGPTPAAMTTPAKPAAKSNRKTVWAVLLIAFVVGIGAAALVLRLTGEPEETATGGEAVEKAQAAADPAPEVTATARASASAEVTPVTTEDAAEAAAPSQTSTPAAAVTGKAPATIGTSKTKATSTKSGTTRKQPRYDPLREL